jgi:Na+-translocating ferredoxin:NAD+ oxidoreductase RnfG subunit
MTGKDILKITVNLVIIYLAGGMLLAAVYARTSPVIFRKNLEEKEQALQQMMPEAQAIVKIGQWEPHEKPAEYYEALGAMKTLAKADKYSVAWKSRNVKDCVKIELMKGEEPLRTLEDCAPNTGLYALDPGGLAEAEGYKVRISTKDGSASAESGEFGVSAGPAEAAGKEPEAEEEAAQAAPEEAPKEIDPEAPEISDVVVGQKIGYIMETFGKGYSSYIDILFSVDPSFVVNRMDILHHGETPGLGDEILKDWFKEQFKGKDREHLVVKKEETTEYIQAITGATISSRAVTEDGVRKGLDKLEEVITKGKGGAEHGSPARED